MHWEALTRKPCFINLHQQCKSLQSEKYEAGFCPVAIVYFMVHFEQIPSSLWTREISHLSKEGVGLGDWSLISFLILSSASEG